MRWRPEHTTDDLIADEENRRGAGKLDYLLGKPRCALLFLIKATIDVKVLSLDFLDCALEYKERYFASMEKSVVRKAVELDGELGCAEQQLKVVFWLFHQNMLKVLSTKKRGEPNEALDF